MEQLHICGRIIKEDDLTFIQKVIRQHWKKGRTFISKELCRRWNWRQPNGYLKDVLCRSLLLRLDRSGFIQLPPHLQPNYQNRNKNRSPSIITPKIPISTEPIIGKVGHYSSIALKQVKRTDTEPLFNYLIHKYHYQGYRFIIGSNLKYIAYLDDRPVACLGWGSATWSVKPRDSFIGWSHQTRRKNLRFIVNNSRFLILPWVQVKFLASKLLALNVKTLPSDWLNFHGHPIFLL